VLRGLGVVDVADGDGESVGGVGGLGSFVEVEQAGDHELDLFFGGEAVADYGALDAERGVFGDGEAAVGCGQHGDSADLAELEGALGVGGEEDFFDGDHLGLPELEECGEFGVDLEQANGGAIFLVEADGSGAEGAELGVAAGVIDFHDTVAGELCSAVDAEDPHADKSTALAASAMERASIGIWLATLGSGRQRFATEGRDRYNRRDTSMLNTLHFLGGRRPLLNALRQSATAGLLVLMTAVGYAQTGQPAAQGQASARPSSPPVSAPIPINRKVIVLDPAHGGIDSGSQISDSTVEKDVTLALAYRLRSLLTARGFTVVMTRDADGPTEPGASGAALTLDDRAGIANHAHAAACLVLHATGSGTGVHLYRSELEGTDGQPTVVPWLTAQAAWIPDSQLLEKQVATAFSRSGVALVASNASVRPIDSLTCPALVVELAPKGDDADSINDTEYQQRVALAIAGAMLFWQNQVQPPARQFAVTGTPVARGGSSDSMGAQP
jgi:N-acetylmuramoyl-L-alanine amidase